MPNPLQPLIDQLQSGVVSRSTVLDQAGIDYDKLYNDAMEFEDKDKAPWERNMMSEVLIKTNSGVEVRAILNRPNIYQVRAGDVFDLCHMAFLPETIVAVETLAAKRVMNKLGE